MTHIDGTPRGKIDVCMSSVSFAYILYCCNYMVSILNIIVTLMIVLDIDCIDNFLLLLHVFNR